MRWALPTLLVLSGCGPKAVEGSLGALLNLDYDSAKLNVSPGQIAVRFVRAKGNGEDEVLEVTERIGGLTLTASSKVDLAEPFAESQRGIVTRDVFNDPRKTFPALLRGTMSLKQIPVSGTNQTVSGSFSLTFVECVDFGCGRTAFANFDARVQ